MVDIQKLQKISQHINTYSSITIFSISITSFLFLLGIREGVTPELNFSTLPQKAILGFFASINPLLILAFTYTLSFSTKELESDKKAASLSTRQFLNLKVSLNFLKFLLLGFESLVQPLKSYIYSFAIKELLRTNKFSLLGFSSIFKTGIAFLMVLDLVVEFLISIGKMEFMVKRAPPMNPKLGGNELNGSIFWVSWIIYMILIPGLVANDSLMEITQFFSLGTLL